MKNVSKETVIRTGLLIFALINNVLNVLGKNPLPFSENQVYEILSTIATVVLSVWAWWKNNSFTQAAIKADEYMKELKSENKQEEVKQEETKDEEKNDLNESEVK